MKLSNQLVKLPQLQVTMRNMSMEMTKVRDDLFTSAAGAGSNVPGRLASCRR